MNTQPGSNPIPAIDSPVIRRLGEIRQAAVAGAGRDAPAASARGRLRAADVRDRLLQEFPATEVRNAISALLTHLADISDLDRAPDPETIDLAEVALILATDPDGISIDRSLVARLERTLPPAIWSFAVQQLIDRYLTRRQSLETLLEGLTRPAGRHTVEDVLTGLRLYQRNGSDADVPRDDDPLVTAVRARLSELSGSSNYEVVRLSQNALKALPAYTQ
jgi:hypothetical protein